MCSNMKRSKGITINRRVRMKNFKTKISTTKTLASAITVLWTWTAWTSVSICSGSARCLSVASSVWAEFTYDKSLTTCSKTVSTARITSSVASAGWCSELMRSTSTLVRGCAGCSGATTGSGASFADRMSWPVI
jgi:hypothetical protein